MSSGPRRQPADAPAQPLDLYRSMLTIRAFETEARRLHLAGKIPGLLHLSIGQEAVAAGVCRTLARTDYIASHHRGHGHCIAKGADLERLFAELLGRRTGYGRGRGGSLHVYDPANANLGTNGIVGGAVPLATGAALTAKLRNERRMAVGFFGDGALNQGLLFECFNMAALWKLPILFVCENNRYGEFTAIEDAAAGADDLKQRAAIFGMPAMDVDGMDAVSVAAAVATAAARARQGQGPSFLLCETYRFGGHHVGDRQDYKTGAERLLWEARDPILHLSKALQDEGGLAAPALEAMQRDAAAAVGEAARRALAAPVPGADDLMIDDGQSHGR